MITGPLYSTHIVEYISPAEMLRFVIFVYNIREGLMSHLALHLYLFHNTVRASAKSNNL